MDTPGIFFVRFPNGRQVFVTFFLLKGVYFKWIEFALQKRRLGGLIHFVRVANLAGVTISIFFTFFFFVRVSIICVDRMDNFVPLVQGLHD